MSLMPWSEQFVLGIAKIDEQHHSLVDQINTMADQSDSKAQATTLEALVEFAMNHFVVEEEMFKRHGYALPAEHMAAQSDFTSKIFDALDAFQGGSGNSNDTLALLKDWLTKHITVVAKAYAPVLRAKGEK
jgi:hemerythrin-like metal-binding protein